MTFVGPPPPENPGNKRRFFVSARDIFLTRLDPFTKDFNPLTGQPIKPIDIWSEQNPTADQAAQFRTSSLLIGEGNTDLSNALANVALKDGLSQYLDVQPIAFTRRINSFRFADELELQLNWKDMPYDARIVRAMLVLHFEGTVDPVAFGSVPPRPNAGGPPAVDPRAYLVPATRSNLRFVGLVDDVNSAHGPDGDQVVVKCRDLTAIFIDTHTSPQRKFILQPGLRIDEAIKRLKSTLPGAAIIQGPFVRPSRIIDKIPVINPRLYPKAAKTAETLNATGQESVNSVVRGPPLPTDESYWDKITDVCVAHGLVPLIELDRFVIQPARTLFQDEQREQPGQANEFTFPTEYRKSIGDTVTTRRMVYGRNIADMHFHRKLARITAPNVQVVSYNPDALKKSERLIDVVFIPEFRKKARAMIAGMPPIDAPKVITVYGVIDRKLLLRIAENVYESIARQELGVTFTTSDPASWSDNPAFDPNQDPDLLDIRAGDPIQIDVDLTGGQTSSDAGQGTSQVQKLLQSSLGFKGGTMEDAVTFLTKSVGFSAKDAANLVKVLTSANLPTVFRVDSATVRFNAEAADFAIEVDARDYVRARDDQGSELDASFDVYNKAAANAVKQDRLIGPSVMSILKGKP